MLTGRTILAAQEQLADLCWCRIYGRAWEGHLEAVVSMVGIDGSQEIKLDVVGLVGKNLLLKGKPCASKLARISSMVIWLKC